MDVLVSEGSQRAELVNAATVPATSIVMHYLLLVNSLLHATTVFVLSTSSALQG